MKTKKGLSVIVSTMILIGLTVAAAGIILVSTKAFVHESLSDTQKCFNILDKVKINNEYTCYNRTYGIVQVSIDVEDIELEGILVSVANATDSYTFTLTADSQDLDRVTNYPSGTPGVVMPKKDSGKTYLISGFSDFPIEITIAPKIEDKQCQASDTLDDIGVC